MTKFDSRPITRRTMLATGAAIGITGALAGCSNAGRGGSTNAAANNASAKSKVRPAYVRYKGVEPDMAGAKYKIPDAFNKYPANPVRAITDAPGDGKPIQVMTFTYTPIPPKSRRTSSGRRTTRGSARRSRSTSPRRSTTARSSPPPWPATSSANCS